MVFNGRERCPYVKWESYTYMWEVKRHCSVTLSTSLCDAEVMRDWTLSVGITLQPQEMSIIYLLQHSVLKKKILNYVCLLHSSFGLCCVCQLIYFCKNKYLCHYHCFCYPLYFSWLLFNILPLFSSDVIYSVSKFHCFVHGRRTSMKKNIWDEDVSL